MTKATTNDQPLDGLHVPAENRTLIVRPRDHGITGDFSADTGPAEPVLSRWLSCPGRPTTLTLQKFPYERTVHWELKAGVSLPDVDLPAVVTRFIGRYDDDRDLGDALGASVADEAWIQLYDKVTETVTPDPIVWQVTCRDVDFGIDHPDLIDNLSWAADLGHIPWNDKGPTFDKWHPGYIDNTRSWVFDQLKAMSLPGVDVLSNIQDPCVHVRQTIPGKTRETATYDARGRKRRTTRRVDATHLVSLSLAGVPRRVSGTDFLDACRKVRALLDELVAEIREVGTVCCPQCDGRGYITTGTKRGKS